ncbi:ribonuclease P protein component 4 [Methanospirillum stamsii]|uniref:Ribonuclease P protein component 4 n=1 Tax=Methanospirillum stamsii TaxID=1277351 RepID=A0A2V2N8E1_9EURY|nr:ribonuclease P protein component 4 [Methanospirillum stamsii]PWR76109.1 ribonuclease P [Methanospirillum stamsii]
MSKKSPRSDRRQIALERIRILFDKADEFLSWDSEFSNRCIRHACLIAMKERIRIPLPLKRRYCRVCKTYLVPGKTGRVRIDRGRVIITCLSCGWHRRFPLSRRKNNHGKEEKNV